MYSDFQIVVSSENTQYMGWQTQLFCYSAVSRLKKSPLIVVHRTDETLRGEFRLLRKLGFRVVEAPSYRMHPRGLYAPRNELGTLVTVAEIVNLRTRQVLFCEPDMLFVSRLDYTGCSVAAEYYRYLHYEEPRVRSVAERYGFGHQIDWLNQTSCFGVPYLLPVPNIPRIAHRWIEVLDSFDAIEWIDIMYAFGIALAVEGMSAEITHIMADNYDHAVPLSAGLIHYCYGDAIWNKRNFMDHSPLSLSSNVLPIAKPGTVLAEIVTQIQEAGRFFRAGQFLDGEVWQHRIHQWIARCKNAIGTVGS